MREIWEKGRQNSDDLSEYVTLGKKGSQRVGHLSNGGAEMLELLDSLPVGCVCRTCGAHVPVDDLRIHLATHQDDAWAFDTDQIWDCFEVSP